MRQALDAGIDGVVSSPHEAAQVRALPRPPAGPDFLIVTPGVPPGGRRPGRPGPRRDPGLGPCRPGATHLVVGRPITAAPDPRAAARAIVQEMAAA